MLDAVRPRTARSAPPRHGGGDSGSEVSSDEGYLVVPGTFRWWLDHYVELRARLAYAAVLMSDEPCCAVYDIRGTATRSQHG